MKYLLAFFVLLISLQSFSTYKFILPVAIVIFMLSCKRKIKTILLSLIFLIFIIYYTLPGVVVYSFEFDMAYFRSTLVGIIAVGLFWASYNYKNKEIFSQAISFALFVNVSFLFLQGFLLYGSGYHLDFTGPLTGHESRVIGPPLFSFRLWRPSGLTFEPGTYATYITPLLFLSYKLSDFKVNKLHLITVISLLFTLSVFAIIFAFSFIIIAYWQVLKNSKIIKVITLPILMAIVYVVYQYISWRFFSGRQDISLGVKLYAFNFLLEQDITRVLTGSFYSFNDCQCLVRDTSLLFNFFFTFGVLGIVFFVILIFSVKGFKTKMMLFVMFLSKMPLFAPILWFFLIGMIVRDDENYICNSRKSKSTRN